MYCPTCGRETRGPRYCTSCGAPLDQAPPLSTEQLREARPEKPARPWRGWAARLARNRVVWAAIAVCAVLLVAFVVWRGRKRDLTLVTEPLMPGFYGALEGATGVRPEKGVRFIGEDGSFYVLQFASQAEAMSAWEKIVSSAGAEKEIGQLEGYVEGAAWLVGDGESELVRLQDDTVIVVPMETSQEADAKTILSSILEPVDSEDIRSGLEGAPLYEPTVSPTLYVRASGTPTPRPTVRTATPTPRRPTAQPTPTSALV
jgi:hypothetical protein